MKGFGLRMLIVDFIFSNLIALAIAFIASFMGRGFAESFILLTFLLSGIYLIFGGILGFFVASALYQSPMFQRALAKILRRQREATEQKRAKAGVQEKPTRRGLRFIIVGAALFLETIVIALAFF